MKKILITLALLATATSANAHERYHRERNDDTVKVIAGVIGGIIIGSVMRERDERSYDYRYERERFNRRRGVNAEKYCVETRYVDYYGNITSRFTCY